MHLIFTAMPSFHSFVFCVSECVTIMKRERRKDVVGVCCVVWSWTPWCFGTLYNCSPTFPSLTIPFVTFSTTDGVQFFLLPLILGNNLLAFLLSNTLYAAAFSWYWYITHLGYRSLPFLSSTEVFLFPIAAVLLVFVLNLVGYPFDMGWNASRLLATVYFHL